MLESMITTSRPTRTECSDVANAVLDGTDCVMLSGETANREHSEAAVTIMARTCYEAEGTTNFDSLYQAVRNSTLEKIGSITTSDSIASSAVKTAIDVSAKCIVVCSESGATAAQVVKFRQGNDITALITKPHTPRFVSGLLKGCSAKILESIYGANKIIEETMKDCRDSGAATPGSPIVVFVVQLIERDQLTQRKSCMFKHKLDYCTVQFIYALRVFELKNLTSKVICHITSIIVLNKAHEYTGVFQANV